MYDVTVAGTGPAGASAAYLLGRAGLKVLVLERQHLPRYKACGGMLSERVLSALPFSFEAVIERRVTAFTYGFGAHLTTAPRDGLTMCCVMRDRFDHHILSQAKANVREGVSVTGVEERADRVVVGTSTGEPVASRYLIGADGANSAVARAMGWRRGAAMGAALEAEVPADSACLDRFTASPHFIFGDAPWGYAWIFPKASHLSVGIGSFRPRGVPLRSLLDLVMTRCGVDLGSVRPRGHALPYTDRRRTIAGGRVLLAGDAAGLVDPFSGEGIRPAIQSAYLASEAIIGEDLQRYQRRIDSHIRSGHAWGRLLAHVLYRFPRASYLALVSDPAASALVGNLLAGGITYRRLVARLLRGLPRHLLGLQIPGPPARL
jgi:geranylgeranyl reductase family protein